MSKSKKKYSKHKQESNKPRTRVYNSDTTDNIITDNAVDTDRKAIQRTK